MDETTKFRNLSLPLKIAIILAWIAGSTVVILFMFGFLLGKA